MIYVIYIINYVVDSNPYSVLDPLIPLIAGIGGGLLLVSVCIVILLITICAVLRKRASPQTIGNQQLINIIDYII